MPIGVFLVFLQYCFIVSYTPGPANLFSMNVGMHYGMKRFWKVYFGLFSAFFLIMVSAATLSYGFEQFIPGIAKVLKVVGTGYILWLAYHIFISEKVEDADGQEVHDSFKSCFLSGFLLNMTNVKVMFIGISIFQLYILDYTSSLPQLLLWCIPVSLFSSTSTIVWALLGSRLSKSYNRHFRVYNAVMAGMLGVCVVGLFI